jgi:hypothetical protein
MSRKGLECFPGNSKPRRISVEAGRQQVAAMYCARGQRSRRREPEGAGRPVWMKQAGCGASKEGDHKGRPYRSTWRRAPLLGALFEPHRCFFPSTERLRFNFQTATSMISTFVMAGPVPPAKPLRRGEGLGRRDKPGHDEIQTRKNAPRREAPGLCQETHRPSNRGRGECRMPSGTRSLVCER